MRGSFVDRGPRLANPHNFREFDFFHPLIVRKVNKPCDLTFEFGHQNGNEFFPAAILKA